MFFCKKNDVKSTTKIGLSTVFDLISPPLCRGCGRAEGFLCPRCKNYIKNHVKVRSLMADFPEAEKVFRKVGFLGFRDEILGEMVEEYKYESVRGLAEPLGEILAAGILKMNKGRVKKLVLVPMPTNRKHIRERGFDHMKLIVKAAQRVLREKGIEAEIVPMLVRAKDTTQVGASEEMRREQAKEAVRLNPAALTSRGKLDKRNVTICIVDDVWTTGASMIEAGKILKGAGAKNLVGVTITKNRYKKSPLIRRGELM